MVTPRERVMSWLLKLSSCKMEMLGPLGICLDAFGFLYKLPWTGWLTVLEARRSQMHVSADVVSGECPSWLLTEASHGRRELSGVPFVIKTLITLMRALPSWTNHFLKAPSPDPITLGLGF
jgi:hypothetical protein